MLNQNLKNWTEITSGLYRYVLSKKCAYELHILCWASRTDILTALASLYLVEDFTEDKANGCFARTRIVNERPVFICLQNAVTYDKENKKC